MVRKRFCPRIPRMPPVTKPVSDRRTTRRSRCVLGCKIVYSPWNDAVHGVIRDLHGDGARVRLRSPVALPSRVTLTVESTGRAYLADVVWRRDEEAGFRFLATDDASAEDQVRALRRLTDEMKRRPMRSTDDGSY